MNIITDNVLYSKEPFSLESGSRRYIFHLLDLIQSELRESGDRDWILDAVQETSIRISHVKGRSMRIGSGFKKLGLNQGDILHISLSTSIDFYWPVFGGWLCGAVVSVGDPNLSVAALKTQIQDTKAKIVVCTHETAEKYLDANKQLPESERIKHILLIDRDPWNESLPGTSSFRRLLDDDGADCPSEHSFPPYNPKESSLINWTSGTTGMPKGVVLSQEHMHFYLRKSKLPAQTCALTTSIFFHGGGFQLALDGGIFNRFKIYFIKPSDFTADEVYKAVEKYKIQFYMCGASEFSAVSSGESSGYDLSSLFVVMPAGAQVRSPTVNKVKAKFPKVQLIYQFYGSTEVGGVSGSFTHQNLGALREGVEVYIRDQSTGKKLGVGEVGEIMAKTPTTMKYYLNRDSETSELYDDNGFVHMGDLGYYDESATLFFRERIKEMLKLKNFWVGPKEIEDVIESIPGVAESIVWQRLNLEIEDYQLEAAVALEAKSNITANQIRDEVNSKLKDYKQINGKIHIVQSLPHNPQGKKLRKQARDVFV